MVTGRAECTRLYAADLVIAAAELGAENPLAPLRPLQEVHAVENVDELPDDLAANIGYGQLNSVLPYRLQDGYDRVRHPRSLRTLVLENEFLRATVLPGLGGRLYSLLHKPSGRELLYRNPVFQPANLGLRNAWFAGGVEWNLGSTGHTTLTCAPMHAGRVAAPDGTPMLRLWEWERTRDLPYQVDLWLPAGSDFLLVAVRIRNPHQHDVPAYWWSNAAIKQTRQTRVLVPAQEAWHFGYTRRLERVPVPEQGGVDCSYPMRHENAADFFFEITAGQRPWIAAVDGDGTGVAQLSTERLRGRKLFVWGESAGGRRWQEWLAPGAEGSGYLEIQAGLARTQLEHLRLPAGTSWDWIEAYGPVSVDPDTVHSGRWETASRSVAATLEARLPDAALAEIQAAWRSAADREPEEQLHVGSGWGALELARLARDDKRVTLAGTPFHADTLGHEQQPWLALLTGVMSAGDPSAAPGDTLVAAPWQQLLEAAEENWLVAYHRGVGRWVAGDHAEAVAAWTRSVALEANPWALRNLAVAASTEGRLADAAHLLTDALGAAPGVRALAVEAITAMLAAGQPAAAEAVLKGLPAEWDEIGRLRLQDAQIRLAMGDAAGAQALFDNGIEVVDLREGETTVSDTWAAAQEQLGGRTLPARYDFRMFGA
jgi:tetratricopeptide (TPR) repeat protein